MSAKILAIPSVFTSCSDYALPLTKHDIRTDIELAGSIYRIRLSRG